MIFKNSDVATFPIFHDLPNLMMSAPSAPFILQYFSYSIAAAAIHCMQCNVLLLQYFAYISGPEAAVLFAATNIAAAIFAVLSFTQLLLCNDCYVCYCMLACNT